MALTALITKVSRGTSDPQINIEVTFRDIAAGFSVQRVLMYGDLSVLGTNPGATVRQEIQRIGREYLDTLSKETTLKSLENTQIEIT